MVAPKPKLATTIARLVVVCHGMVRANHRYTKMPHEADAVFRRKAIPGDATPAENSSFANVFGLSGDPVAAKSSGATELSDDGSSVREAYRRSRQCGVNGNKHWDGNPR